MSVTIRKLAVADIATIQRLVIEHADGMEPGLSVLDSCLRVGEATIDVVACDAQASLILIAVGLVADEDMLLRAVEGYAWCLEYPDAVRRLYPAAEISSQRPPRMVFIADRVPDAFQRKIKQLGFSEVDFVEARYVDVDGTPAVFFDVVARLRRGVPPAPAVVPAAATTTLFSMSADAPAPRPAPGVAPAAIPDNVIPLNGGARATSVKLQRLLHAGGEESSPRAAAARASSTPSEPRTVVPMSRVEVEPAVAASAAVRPTVAVVAAPTPTVTVVPAMAVTAAGLMATAPEAIVAAAAPDIDVPPSPGPTAPIEPGTVAGPIPPVTRIDLDAVRLSLRQAAAALIGRAAPRDNAGAAVAMARDAALPSRISLASIASELLGARAPQEPGAGASPGAPIRYPIEEDARVAVEELLGSAPSASALAPDPAPEAVTPQPVEPAPAAPPVATPKPVQPPVWAAVKPQAAIPVPPATNGATTVEPKIAIRPAAATSTAPVTAPRPRLGVKTPLPQAVGATGRAHAAPAPAAPAVPTEQAPRPNLPAEIAGLQFPHDGQLTRQWIDFLNQIAASK